MNTSKLITSLSTLGLLLASSLSYAFPIAASGTEGRPVLVGGTDDVIATYRGNSAAYSNDLYLMLNTSGNPGDDGDTSNDLFIFNNHSSSVGSTENLGSFAIGTELMFRLYVNNTNNNYFSGGIGNNPDGHIHARVQENWMPNETLVSFEDLYNGPFDYNDLSFSFTNTVTTDPIDHDLEPVPEPPVMLLLGAGFGILGFMRRRVGAKG